MERNDRQERYKGNLAEIKPVSAMRGPETGGYYTMCWLVGFD